MAECGRRLPALPHCALPLIFLWWSGQQRSFVLNFWALLKSLDHLTNRVYSTAAKTCCQSIALRGGAGAGPVLLLGLCHVKVHPSYEEHTFSTAAISSNSMSWSCVPTPSHRGPNFSQDSGRSENVQTFVLGGRVLQYLQMYPEHGMSVYFKPKMLFIGFRAFSSPVSAYSDSAGFLFCLKFHLKTYISLSVVVWSQFQGSQHQNHAVFSHWEYILEGSVKVSGNPKSDSGRWPAELQKSGVRVCFPSSLSPYSALQ